MALPAHLPENAAMPTAFNASMIASSALSPRKPVAGFSPYRVIMRGGVILVRVFGDAVRCRFAPHVGGLPDPRPESGSPTYFKKFSAPNRPIKPTMIR